MNKLTEIREAMKEVTTGPWGVSKSITPCSLGNCERVELFSLDYELTKNDYEFAAKSIQVIPYLLSLLEEKDKALAFYADEKNYMELKDHVTRSIIPIIPIAEDQGAIARKALNTSSNSEGDKP